MQIHREKNKETLLRAAAAAVSAAVKSAAGKPVLFLSSGGSSLGLLPLLDASVFGPHVTIGMTDERWSRDPAVNNFAQLAATAFYSNAKAHGAAFINTDIGEGEKLDAVGERYDANLKHWKQSNPDGVCIATVGIGPDAHICGILPNPENPDAFEARFNTEGKWAVGYDAIDKTQYNKRITITYPFMRSVLTAAIIFMTGANKTDALRKSRQRGSYAEAPARIIAELAGAQLFTDIEI